MHKLKVCLGVMFVGPILEPYVTYDIRSFKIPNDMI